MDEVKLSEHAEAEAIEATDVEADDMEYEGDLKGLKILMYLFIIFFILCFHPIVRGVELLYVMK